jgi:hypothetical protein
VQMPSQIVVRIQSHQGRWVAFEVLNAQGEPAIRDGVIRLRT